MKQVFLRELRMALQGEVSQEAVNEHIKYYENYIMEEIRKGKNEEDVISELGNPRLIAKTLIDTTEQFGPADQEYNSEDFEQSTMGHEKGFHANYSQEHGWDFRLGRLKLNSWYGKILLIAAAILIIVIVANLVAFLLPIVIPVVLVLLVISFIFGNRR